MKENQKDEPELSVSLPHEIADGQYANLAVITHSHSEFILDFVLVMPGRERGVVKSRIILTPEHAKRMREALDDNIEKFEEQHGELKTVNQKYPMSFGGMQGEA